MAFRGDDTESFYSDFRHSGRCGVVFHCDVICISVVAHDASNAF